jgi:putative acetyltransferase
MTRQAPSLTFGLDDPAAPAVRALVEQLDGQLRPRGGPSLELLSQPGVAFVTARVDGQPVACGACVDRGDYVELHRMYVLPACRGLGLGRQLLDALEAQVRARGAALIRLETGVAQAEALELYEHAGYRRCGPFGGYPADPQRVFMEKPLA